MAQLKDVEIVIKVLNEMKVTLEWLDRKWDGRSIEQKFDDLTDESLLGRMERSFETFKNIHPTGVQKLSKEEKSFYSWRKWLAYV